MTKFDGLSNRTLFSSYSSVDLFVDTLDVPEYPVAELETDLGTVTLTFQGDSIDAEIPALTTIFTVDYLVHGTIRLNHHEEWRWSDYTYRATIPKDDRGYNPRSDGIRTDPGEDARATDAAQAQIQRTIIPVFEDWLSMHYDYLRLGFEAYWERAFATCENKLRKQEMKLAQRREWLRRLRDEYERTGTIADQDDRHQLTNTSGNDWWIR